MSGTVYNKVYNDFLANNTKNNNINNTKDPWKNAGEQKGAQFLKVKYEAPGPIAYPNIVPEYSGGAKKIDDISKGLTGTSSAVDETSLKGDKTGDVTGDGAEDETGDETEDSIVSPTLSYEDFLKQNGFDIEGDKERAILRAAQEYDRSRATYGMKAENLAQAGLTNSGYSDYTDAMAYAAYIGNLSQAERDAIYKELQASALYQNYLTQKRAEDRAITQQNFENDQAVKDQNQAITQQKFENMVTLLTSGLAPEVASTLIAALGYSEEEVAEFMKNYNQIYNQTVKPETTPETTPEVTPEEEVYPMYAQLIGEGYSDVDAKMILAANGYADGAITSASNAYYANNGAGGTVATNNVVEAVKNADLSGNAVDAIPTLISQSVAVDMQTGLSDTGKSESKGAVSAALKDLFIKSIDDVDTLLTYAASAIASEFGGKKDETGVKGWNKAEYSTKADFLLGLVDEAYKTNALTDADYKEFYEQTVSSDLEKTTDIEDFAELAVKAYDNQLCPSNKKLSNEMKEETMNLLAGKITDVYAESDTRTVTLGKKGTTDRTRTTTTKHVYAIIDGEKFRIAGVTVDGENDNNSLTVYNNKLFIGGIEINASDFRFNGLSQTKEQQEAMYNVLLRKLLQVK